MPKVPVLDQPIALTLGARSTMQDVLAHVLRAEDFEYWAVVRIGKANRAARILARAGADRAYWQLEEARLARLACERLSSGGSLSDGDGATVAVPITNEVGDTIALLMGCDRRPLRADRLLLDQLRLHARLIATAIERDQYLLRVVADDGERDGTTGCLTELAWSHHAGLTDRYCAESGRDLALLSLRVVDLAERRWLSGRDATDDLLREVAYAAQYASDGGAFGRVADNEFASVRDDLSRDQMQRWHDDVRKLAADLGPIEIAVAHRSWGSRKSLAALLDQSRSR